VTHRGRPIARIVPATMPDGLARMILEGRVSWSGRKPTLPKRMVRLRGPGKTLSEMIVEDRG
ncbi:MAG: type II toxin-antitoxin system prevent-host-death family antitoxin, partial [Candidatus Limnocylindria bacterium]